MDDQTRPALIGRREFLIGGIMAATSAVALARTPQPYVPPLKQDVLEAAVPRRVGDWRSEDGGAVVLPPPDALRDRLYDNLLTRVYTNPAGQVLMLVLAYKNIQDGIVQVHRPEVCYPAAGFALEDERHLSLRLPGHEVPAKAFAARRPDRIEQVLYFTRLGARFPLSWRDQRFAVLEANLAGQIPDGLLARVSIIQNDQSTAIMAMTQFFEMLVAEGDKTFRGIMIGTA